VLDLKEKKKKKKSMKSMTYILLMKKGPYGPFPNKTFN
jgi:hypothetical protein